jgi:localization factor PodJL
MRAELPWNVAGIPPEAREPARAAARREGLSVGEWLTHRILRSFSGMEEEIPPMAYENRAPTGAPLDSWGLPPSANSRRDTEDMMARVNRSEHESNDAWRRIEDQLRGLGRRIDSSERSHSESNRVISRTAQEINTSAREQAQAFDLLGLNVMTLNERLERLERSNADTGIKEAVKALHQGLSRLADQITATANNSADQVTQLTGNLEQLAARVGQGRVDAEDNHKLLIVRTEAAEQRLAAAEKTAQFNTNALDHALEKIEASTNQRATDQVKNQRRFGQTEESINRLEDSIARLEMRLPDAAFERRLDSIEHSVSGIAERLENYDPKAQFDASMQALSHRLESLEKDHTDLVAEMRTKLRCPEPPAFEAPPPASAAFEATPFAQAPYQDAFAPPQVLDGYGAEGTDAFAPPQAPPGFAFDIPPRTGHARSLRAGAGIQPRIRRHVRSTRSRQFSHPGPPFGPRRVGTGQKRTPRTFCGSALEPGPGGGRRRKAAPALHHSRRPGADHRAGAGRRPDDDPARHPRRRPDRHPPRWRYRPDFFGARTAQ